MGRALALAGTFVAVCACRAREPLPFAGFVDAPVAAVASQLSGRVVRVLLREGEFVHREQLLAQLESSTYEAAVAQAEANLTRSREALAQAEGNLHAAAPAVTGASADIARAQATRDEAEIDYRRSRQLAATHSVPPSDLDAAHARLAEAQASLDSMIATRAQTRGRLAAAYAGVNDARAAVDSSQAALEYAQAQLAQTRVLSPFDGLVISRNVEEGEWAAPGTPIMTVEDTGRTWVRLDVPETMFGNLHVGQPARVRVLALFGRSFVAHVTQIGAEGDFAINRDVKRGRPDIRTFMVRVAFDVPPPQLRPGMTAEVSLLGHDDDAHPIVQ